MSDHLPPLADLLPHLHAGDHITADVDGYQVAGLVHGANGMEFARWYLADPDLDVKITSAPDAHQRWKDAQQPTWASDPSVAVVQTDVRNYDFPWDWFRCEPDRWWSPQEDGYATTAQLIERGARPVARYIADQPAPEPATCDRDHEPPIGAKVYDRSGSEWTRYENGKWSVTAAGLQGLKTWDFVWDLFGPLTLVEDGTNTGAEQ